MTPQDLLSAVLSRHVYVYPVTEAYPLQERLRLAIRDSKLGEHRIERESSVTFDQAFERVFSESTKGN